MKKHVFLTILLVLAFSLLCYAAWDGATNFPGSLDTDATLYDVEDDGTIEDEHHDALAQAVIAVETKLGTGDSAATDGKVLTGTGAGTSAWAQVDLTSEVTGTLPVTNGGMGAATFTDHGVLVGSAAGAVTALSVGTSTQALMGVTDADPAFTTLREFSRLDLTEDTSISEAQVIANKYITNQGDAGEADLTLPAVSYGAQVIFICEEEVNIEINPPAGEAFDLDGVTLDANDCVDSDSTVGSKISATRMKNAAGTWHWSLDTIRGVWTDTGASD